jgi:hypothetical protein
MQIKRYFLASLLFALKIKSFSLSKQLLFLNNIRKEVTSSIYSIFQRGITKNKQNMRNDF